MSSGEFDFLLTGTDRAEWARRAGGQGAFSRCDRSNVPRLPPLVATTAAAAAAAADIIKLSSHGHRAALRLPNTQGRIVVVDDFAVTFS